MHIPNNFREMKIKTAHRRFDFFCEVYATRKSEPQVAVLIFVSPESKKKPSRHDVDLVSSCLIMLESRTTQCRSGNREYLYRELHRATHATDTAAEPRKGADQPVPVNVTRPDRPPNCVTVTRIGNIVLTVNGYCDPNVEETTEDKLVRLILAEAARLPTEDTE